MTSTMPAARRQHICYFDPLRLIAAFCVIYMHTASGLLRTESGLQWELVNIFTSFSFTAVPLFLMMSGYLLLSDEKTMDIPYLFSKRLPRLVIPLCFWTAVATVETLLAQHTLTPGMFVTGMVTSFHYPAQVSLWYMYLLIALYVISPLLRGCMKSLDETGHRYVLALIAAVMVQTMLLCVLPENLEGYVSFDILERLKIFSGDLGTFILGYYLARTKRRFPNWLLAAVAAVLLVVITAGTHMLTARAGEYTADFQAHSSGFEVALASCVFLLWKQNCTKPIPRFLAPMVSLSLPIYLMHGLLLVLMGYFGIISHSLLEAIGQSAAIFLVCYLCTKTAASVKPFCFLITGLRYQDACRSCNWQYTFRGRKAAQ